ncbi:MAG: family 78 glycoside hydrolase catalytic domain [Victivallales bacterium]|nr:family 78 glycoside hydrolase catalytic domain [Victivallales bacterium]
MHHYKKISQVNEFNNASWIGCPGRVLTYSFQRELPAPFFRKEFNYEKSDIKPELVVAAAGYYEVYINGRKLGTQVLAPTPTIYDKRIYFNRFPVGDYLQEGRNVVGVVLGNSFYNSGTLGPWVIDKASWRDYPKFILQVNSNDKCVVYTDESWQVHGDGPIRYDSIRNGEFYDAGMEFGDDWSQPGFIDCDGWKKAMRIHGPGGELCEEKHEPCVVFETFKMKPLPGNVYDSGQNLAGWVKIKVKGSRGAEVIIRYSEKLDESEKINRDEIGCFVETGEFQTDKYTLKGEGIECWQPRFTYHGFRYVEIELNGNAEIISLEACAVGTGFDSIGKIDTSSSIINSLQKCTYWSFRSNFVGFPIDCPHREKQGWTGDALLAAETGLFNFDSSNAYSDWLVTLADTQRPSGQIMAKAPTSGWGYNWGYGPAWDSALIVIPALIYVHTGECGLIKRLYGNMQRYMDFCDSMATGYLIDFGLGDFCSVTGGKPDMEMPINSSAFYYSNAVMMSRFAAILNLDDDFTYYKQLAECIKDAFNKKYYKGEGIYAGGSMTELAAALYHDLAVSPQKTADILADMVIKNDYKVDFGILGAKYVPRVLADYSHINTAFRMFVQEEYPGWAYWLKQGATTLWEYWNSRGSNNHIFKGDISAWLYCYAGGFKPSIDNPGCDRMEIAPVPIDDLNYFKAEYRGYVSEWKHSENKIEFKITVPENAIADYKLPGLEPQRLKSGMYCYKC